MAKKRTKTQPSGEQTEGQTAELQDKQNNAQNDGGNEGVVSGAVLEEEVSPDDLARERAVIWRQWKTLGVQSEAGRFREQVRQECIARGMAKAAANAHSWRAVIEAFPVSEAPVPSPETPPAAEKADAGRLPGIGDIPQNWPPLPPNASLQVELSWVQSNRLLVVSESSSGKISIDLAKAYSPAPSMSALGWLETSVRSYAKYVDIVARSLATQADEQQAVRAERVAIEEIRSLLAEMLE